MSRSIPDLIDDDSFPSGWPANAQNLVVLSWTHLQLTMKISSQSVHNFTSSVLYFAHRRPTNAIALLLDSVGDNSIQFI